MQNIYYFLKSVYSFNFLQAFKYDANGFPISSRSMIDVRIESIEKFPPIRLVRLLRAAFPSHAFSIHRGSKIHRSSRNLDYSVKTTRIEFLLISHDSSTIVTLAPLGSANQAINKSNVLLITIDLKRYP